MYYAGTVFCNGSPALSLKQQKFRRLPETQVKDKAILGLQLRIVFIP
jgi:hypothetical protein